MPLPILAACLLGLPPAPPTAGAIPPRVEAVQAAPVLETDATRVLRLRALVEAAERFLEEDDEEAAWARCEEADALTADWPTDLLKQSEVQALLQRLKDAQDQFSGEPEAEPEPGLKADEEVITLQGDLLKGELERVRAAEQGATYDFPIDLNDRVLTWVNLFTTSRRGFMENALARGSQYLPMARQVFLEEGIPADLAYLALIESGYRNDAASHAKAVGMWQFIRATGRIYGLNANSWLEERRDPMKATRAAARYLKRLYQITGDWYLAASSYNAGPLTLERAMQNVGSRNFWDLARSRWLRTETKNYVPELCAAILIGRNPERYGLKITPMRPYAYETVTVSNMTSLTLLAKCVGTDAATLKQLNPELLRGSTPPGTYQLRVPPGQALDCLRQLARLPLKERVDFKAYVVQKRDTLASVAKRFKVSPEDLLAVNELTAKQFKTGKRILVPPPPSLNLDERDIAASSPKKPLGDRALAPLPAVPKDPGALAGDPEPVATDAAPATAVDTPKPMPIKPKAEKVTAPKAEAPKPEKTVASNTNAPGAEKVTAPKAEAPKAAAPTSTPKASAPATVRVKAGDTLAKLGREYGIPLGTLIRLNPETLKSLKPGDEVRLTEASAPAKAPAKKAPTSHTVVKGDTLTSIAHRYDLDPDDLKTWNHLKGGQIQVGQKLRLRP